MTMIYAVMAAVLGFAVWQLCQFVRRIHAGGCASGDCTGCDCSLKKYKMRDKEGGNNVSNATIFLRDPLGMRKKIR
jgi:hypothetical protein